MKQCLRKADGTKPIRTKKYKQGNTYLDVGNIVSSDLDVDDAAGRLAHDRAAVLQADDLAVVTDVALDLARERRACGRDEGGVSHEAAPGRDGSVVVLLGEGGVGQRADGRIVHGSGRHGCRDADEILGADEEGHGVVLGGDELDIESARYIRSRKGHEGRGGESEEEELQG